MARRVQILPACFGFFPIEEEARGAARLLFKKYRIGFLYFGSFSIFIVLVLAVVIWTSYRFSVSGIVTNTSVYQEKILTELNERLQAQFATIDSISLSISRNNDILDFLTDQGDSYRNISLLSSVRASLLTMSFSMPIISSIHLYMDAPPDNDRQSPVQFYPLGSMEEQLWYSNVVKQSDFVWIGQHTIETHQGKVPVISFVRKLYSRAGDFKGVLLINLKATDIQTLLAGKETFSNRLLLDSGGRVITRIGNNEIDRYAEQYMSVMERHKKDGVSHVKGEKAEFGLTSLIVWSNVAASDWMLFDVTPWDKVTEGSRRMAIALMTIGLLAIAVVLPIILFLNRQFTKPIYLLLKLMNRYPRRMDDVRMPSDYRNEFGQLFGGYEKLIMRIENLYNSLGEQYERQRVTEIKALQAMINPHFLYNTLDQLNWMAIGAKQEKMSRVLELMGRMLRLNLSDGESLITVQDELEHLECYMQIQQIRLGHSFVYCFDVSESCKERTIPKMTLQPFVENSFKHGFHGRCFGRIAIAIAEEGNELVIGIEDDGAGFPDRIESQQPGVRGGYGIRNVRERIDAFYGQNYRIELGNAPSGGAVVTLRIPLHVRV